MELVTAVLGDHGQRPHEDYGIIFYLFVQENSCYLEQLNVFRFSYKTQFKLINRILFYLEKDEFYFVKTK